MGKFDRYAFSAQPSFNEAATREAFSHAVPLKTVVIYCYNPRAAEIPGAVAKLLGDEVFPGEIILDGSGKRVASSTTLFPVIVAGGRAVDALRSITVAQHLLRDPEHRRRSPFALRRDEFHGRWHHRRLPA